MSSLSRAAARLPRAGPSTRSLPLVRRALSAAPSTSAVHARSPLSINSSRLPRLSLARRHASSAAAVKEVEEEESAREADAVPQIELPLLTEKDRSRLIRQRNVGISAHIDSGKTTLTERVLYYTGRVRDIHEVRGRDGVGAKMDSMELEREKGITIQSAATFCDWVSPPPPTETPEGGELKNEKEKFAINIIDTPGHVDFTIEVERALRVLDGAVLVLCAVSGVQSQTITVDRQMKRYNVPRLAFINKMDRAGANPWRVIDQLRNKLKHNAAAVQIPIGAEDQLRGVIDLIRMRAVYNEGVKGNEIREGEIPAEHLEFAQEKRNELIAQLSEADETLSDKFLMEEPISALDIAQAIRRSTIGLRFTPVFMGSAIKNTGVQPVLDGVCMYLPDPAEVVNTALNADRPADPPVRIIPAGEAPLISLAFKLEEGRFGQLTYLRVYQGVLRKGTIVINARTGKRVKLARLVRMHSNEMEDVDMIGAGEICAIFGVECSSGDTFTDGNTSYTMTAMYVPEPVISLAIRPEGHNEMNFSRAINRFQKEDPTFRVHIDRDSGETIISGMGELHLEVYVERIKREYKIACTTGKPRVAFRETITQEAEFNYTHKRQTGGAGQFGRVQGRITPCEMDLETGSDIKFVNHFVGSGVSSSYFPAIEKGFREALERGHLSGHRVTGVAYIFEDGSEHMVDSSELSFRLAAIGGFREAFNKAKPVILEPVMQVEIVAPVEFQGAVIGGINQRKGVILDSETRDDEFTLTAEVSLNDMFGYSGNLRSITQGKGEFSMEYKRHQPVLPGVQKEMNEAYMKKLIK